MNQSAPPARSENVSIADPALAGDDPRLDDLIEADLLVEDVSIDGMCGVY